MQRLPALRRLLASSAAIILPENDQPTRIHSYARADSVPIRLHAHELHFDEMVAIPIVLEEAMEPGGLWPEVSFRADPVFYQEVEESVIVIIRPCRDLMRRASQIILKRHARRGCHVGKCSIPIVVVKDIGISEAYGPCAGSRDKQVEKSVVIVIAPNRGPSICCRVDTGFCRNIAKRAVAVVAKERVYQRILT